MDKGSRGKGFLNILFLLFGLLSGSIFDSTYGQAISQTEAVEIAHSWISQSSSNLKSAPYPDSVFLLQPGSKPIYVVTFRPAGFVILPAEKSDIPVFGYSTQNHFPSDPEHPLRDLLIPAYSMANMSKQKMTSPLFKGNSSLKTDFEVEPLIGAHWGQGDPWNKYCPEDESGQHALVGCVAVAMSQIMYTWGWPERGAGSNTYTPPDHREYGEVSANFDTTYYQWDQMENFYPTDASALILFHSGVATFMNYGPNESGSNTAAYAIPAFKDNFRYNPALLFREMEDHDYFLWTKMIRQELANNRPVLYNGTNPESKIGHAFNIDGFRENDFFHFNWGWDGSGNGWFNLDKMAGGSANFSLRQGAIFGIQPETIPQHDRPTIFKVLQGDEFAHLFWDNPIVTDLSRYFVYRDGVQVGYSAVTNFVDEGLTNGESYTYQITAEYVGQRPGESNPTPSLTVQPWEQVSVPYLHGFESDTLGWQFEDNNTGFRIDQANNLPFTNNDGAIAYILSDGMEPSTRVIDHLVSPVIYPGNFTNLAVSFDYVFKQKPGVDYLYLMYRRFSDGLWNLVTRLDSTGGWGDWKTVRTYIPEEAGSGPIQLGFYYNNFYGEGFGAAIDNISFYEVHDPPTPAFSMDNVDICEQDMIKFTNESSGIIFDYVWDFGEGANPRYASTPGPHLVTYETPGKKDVKLSLNYVDHLLKKDILTVRAIPESGFRYEREAMTISFINEAVNFASIFWDFGDGFYSNDLNPVHTYISKDVFPVLQVVSNGSCDPDTTLLMLNMQTGTGIHEEALEDLFRVFPNPTSGIVHIDWKLIPQNRTRIEVYTPVGQLVHISEHNDQKLMTIDLSHQTKGLYIIQIINNKKSGSFLIHKTG